MTAWLGMCTKWDANHRACPICMQYSVVAAEHRASKACRRFKATPTQRPGSWRSATRRSRRVLDRILPTSTRRQPCTSAACHSCLTPPGLKQVQLPCLLHSSAIEALRRGASESDGARSCVTRKAHGDAGGGAKRAAAGQSAAVVPERVLPQPPGAVQGHTVEEHVRILAVPGCEPRICRKSWKHSPALARAW